MLLFLPRTSFALVILSTLGGCGNSACSITLQVSTSNSGCQRRIFSFEMCIGVSKLSKNFSCSSFTLSALQR